MMDLFIKNDDLNANIKGLKNDCTLTALNIFGNRHPEKTMNFVLRMMNSVLKMVNSEHFRKQRGEGWS